MYNSGYDFLHRFLDDVDLKLKHNQFKITIV